MTDRTQNAPGNAVDAQGRRAIDPTENVLALVEAAVKRQDDLRIAAEKFMEAELQHVRIVEGLRAEHRRDISAQEKNRLDAIRQVDVMNQSSAAKAASDAIAVLAATTATNAEKLREDLAATAALMAKQTADVATAMATQTASTVSAITDRLASLEKSTYQGAGRAAVVDPALAELMTDMKAMLREQATGAGKTQGIGAAWAIASAVLALVVSVASIVFSQTRVPQIIYSAPAPVASVPK